MEKETDRRVCGQIEYELIRSARKTIAIQVAADGSVTVRTPRRCSRKAAEDFVREKQQWVLRKQHEMKQRSREQEEEKKNLPKWGPEDYQRYRELAGQVLRRRTAYFADRMGVDYGRITIRDQRTRWGSCSARGNLNFNWRLILAPAEVLDYVVVHELAHRREMNHSGQFWRLVGNVLPDYQARRQWLKKNGELLMGQRQEEERDGK